MYEGKLMHAIEAGDLYKSRFGAYAFILRVEDNKVYYQLIGVGRPVKEYNTLEITSFHHFYDFVDIYEQVS